MSGNDMDAAVRRAMRRLADRRRMAQQGIDAAWIERCALLIEEYRQLQQRFQELEAELGSEAEGSSDDTIVM